MWGLIIKEIKMFEVQLVKPTEVNGYNFFDEKYENDSTIAFHCTPIKNFNLICKDGFKSAKKIVEEGIGLNTISFAKNSSQCLVYMGKPIKGDFCVFAVEFDSTHPSLDTTDVYIYIDDSSVQPKIISYCLINKGFDYI